MFSNPSEVALMQAANECLNMATAFRAIPPDSTPDCDELRNRYTHLLKQIYLTPRDHLITRDDQRAVVYALTALFDELCLRHPHTQANWMSCPIQLELFQENRAGDGFYRQLDHLIRQDRSHAALLVFYLCLRHGFRGRLAGPDHARALGKTVRRLGRRLSPLIAMPPLSSSHRRPNEPSPQRTLRSVLHPWIGVFSLLFAGAFIFALWLTMNKRAESVLERTHALFRTVEP